jgi:hypothetical protein
VGVRLSDFIPIRQYAKLKGVSDVAVLKAIKAGHIYGEAISYGENGKRNGVNPKIADAQWSRTISVNKSRKDDVKNRFPDAEQTPDPEPDSNAQFSGPTSAPSVAKAQQVEAVYKAKLRELEYKRKSGELISKDATYRALFSLGQEIRTALQAIPDRAIDEILAAPTRNDSHTVLTREIHDVLTRLSKMQSDSTLEGL